METRANYVLIGLFTLAVIVGAFGFVYWFHHVGGVAARSYYRIVFQGPIGGLRPGAQVNFNGIRIGEVTALGLDPADPRQSVVMISVDTGAPLRADTRASLEFQGLTGIATLALQGGNTTAGPVPRKDGMPTLTADRVASQDMMQAARDTLNRIDTVLAENQQAIKNSIRNIELFSEALARNTGKIDTIMAGLENAIGGPDGKGEIPEAARAIRNAADNLDKKIDTLVTDGRRTLGVIEKTVRNFDENPTRLIFGGGRPANPRPSRQAQ